MMTQAHQPVFLDSVIDLLAPVLQQPGSIVVDATLGMAGHASHLLAECPHATLIGLDRDPMAVERAHARLAAYADRAEVVHAVYDELPAVLAARDINNVSAILFDLGVSSPQLDLAERGFSYAQDAPLDMRMDQTTGITAAEIVNTYPATELARLLSRYGDERFARRVAAAIVAARPLTSSARLAELVRDAIPAATRRTGGHPAKRTFQALRIAVNDELAVLERALPAALDALQLGGRIVVLAYHSGEDRLVKQALTAVSRSTTPPELPVELPDRRPQFRLLVRGEAPTAAEIAENPRAASARLRAAERVREAS